MNEPRRAFLACGARQASARLAPQWRDWAVAVDAAPWLRIDWPGNPRVRAAVTSRAGGVSCGVYAAAAGKGGLNLGDHVGDDAAAVAANRAALQAAMGNARPRYLHQVHGITVADLEACADDAAPTADAALTTRPGVAATVLVADCLPVLFAAPEGSGVAAAHAGWRGLAGGVLEATLAALCARTGCAPEQVQIALGPAIGPEAFEVGEEVRQAFVAHDPAATQAFRPGAPGKWWADLWALARQRLVATGADPRAISGGGLSTHADAARWYSYRRDGQTGRLAASVWIEPSARNG